MAEKTRLALLTDAAGTVLALDEWAMSHGGFSYVLSTVSNRPETVLYVFANPEQRIELAKALLRGTELDGWL